jgi:hypothetical protein
MTQYMLSVHHTGPDDPAFQMSPEDMQATFEAVDAVNAEMQATGAWVFGGGLEMPDSATTVSAHQGETLMTDGPFAETKELVAGFWLWQVRSMDEALEWAKRCPNPMEEGGVLELRPVFEAEDFGEELTPELREQDERLRAEIADREH